MGRDTNIFEAINNFKQNADPYLEEDLNGFGKERCSRITPGLNPGLFINNGFGDERSYNYLKTMENLLLERTKTSSKLKSSSKRKRAQKRKRRRNKKEGKRKVDSSVQVWLDLDEGNSWMLL